MTLNLEKTLREGLMLSVGILITSFFIAVAEVGSLNLVVWSHRFLQMDSGFIFGPFLTWIWGMGTVVG